MSIGSKETTYSLHNADNFKKELESSYNDVMHKLRILLTDYLKFILENTTIKNTFYVKFVIMRGLHTIIHVFRHLLYHTKNLDLTYFHCQKSFYFYVEFVGQILEDDKTFLQLTTKDAVLYVYKKTIYDINNEIRIKTQNCSPHFNELMQKLDVFIQIVCTIIEKTIDPSIDKAKLEQHTTIIDSLLQIINFDIKHLKYVEKIIDKMATDIKSIDDFFDISVVFFKKTIKNYQYICTIYQKIFLLDFDVENDMSDAVLKQIIFSVLL